MVSLVAEIGNLIPIARLRQIENLGNQSVTVNLEFFKPQNTVN